jgi:hypothetical protein
MSSFSAEWLFLREPHDHRARNVEVLGGVARAFSGREHISAVDFACGTGSNLRGILSYLPERQTWRLVDADASLLIAAKQALIAFADEVISENPLRFRKSGRIVEVKFVTADLKTETGEVLEEPADLVTAAAFFDLVSPTWMDYFCEELENRNLPLYTILNYAGQKSWRPPHAADTLVLAAFHQHQAQDKGFGPAAGPKAASILKRMLEGRGFCVSAGPSFWRLNRGDEALIAALADGIASAVLETHLVPRPTVEEWREARMTAIQCEIGHIDLFAVPPEAKRNKNLA